MASNKATRKQLLAAINSTNRRVAIPDVVAQTGLPLGVVSSELNDLAYELGADLDVTESGQIYYQFPSNLRYRYYSNRFFAFTNKIWETIAPVLAFLFRISFGLMLLFSITLVFLVMLVLQSLMSVFSGNANDVIGLIKEFFTLLKRLQLFQGINPMQFKRDKNAVDFSPVPLNSTKGNDSAEQVAGVKDDKGFLLNCYALLFGPGNPNQNFENEKSKAVAQLIRANQGIILPEQLAPLVGAAATEVEAAFPVLAKFHGVPGATPSGHLIYKFPEMQAAVSKSALNFAPDARDEGSHESLHSQPPRAVTMQPVVFTDISTDSLKPILLLACSNFFGTVFFWYMLYAVQSSDSSSENFFLVLAIYASFFLFFPAFRWINVQFQNARIRKYNERIEKLSTTLDEAAPDLTLAFNEVHKIRQDEVAQLTNQLAYTTRRDYLEQETDSLIENASQTDKPAV